MASVPIEMKLSLLLISGRALHVVQQHDVGLGMGTHHAEAPSVGRVSETLDQVAPEICKLAAGRSVEGL
jgi:hypothetical protein